MSDPKDKTFDFAKAIEELEEINRWFQNEEINLDEGLSKFRRGLELIKRSRERLKQVENEFKEIKKEFSTEGKTTEGTEDITEQKEENNLKEIKPDEIPF